ncbi:hypothetical protein HYX16_06205 [Candidatus Woesearchaeota archaeon]|nr:hypothetical protein [Candidatus Woesearchaeota archaeon]
MTNLIQEVNLENYIILPEITSGNYWDNHPTLGIEIMELSHRDKKHPQTKEALKQERSFMLNPNELVEAIGLLKSEEVVYNGKGNRISNELKKRFLDELIALKNPWRGTRLDHQYSIITGHLYGVSTHQFDSSGKLIEVLIGLDENTLMEDRISGIDFDDWIKNPNQSGLPRKNVKEGRLYYWKPREGKVAGFGADAFRADLVCDGNPLGSGADLGVRRAKILDRETIYQIKHQKEIKSEEKPKISEEEKKERIRKIGGSYLQDIFEMGRGIDLD